MTDRPIRILWTSNIDLPAAAPQLGLAPTPFGGWLTLMTSRLARLPGFEIAVAMRSESRRFQKVEVEGITYFALPQQKDRFDVAQADVDRVLAEFSPDILHVEGAEMRHARRFLSTWTGPRLLSMQGVLNGYASYELGFLPIFSMLNPLRPRLMLTAMALLFQRQRQFIPRLPSEREAMRSNCARVVSNCAEGTSRRATSATGIPRVRRIAGTWAEGSSPATVSSVPRLFSRLRASRRPR